MNNNLNKNKNGCLWFFVIGLLTFFGYVFLHLVFGVGTFTTLIIVVGLSVAFLTLVLGRTYRKMLIRSGFIIFFILIWRHIIQRVINDLSCRCIFLIINC